MPWRIVEPFVQTFFSMNPVAVRDWRRCSHERVSMKWNDLKTWWVCSDCRSKVAPVHERKQAGFTFDAGDGKIPFFVEVRPDELGTDSRMGEDKKGQAQSSPARA